MEEILVSILILAYNAEKTISNTIESAVNQTYKNLELVIMDDSSKDDTRKVALGCLKKYPQRFTDVKYIFL
jgi:glycosyltransferase involved in cell wall biosynthesis